MGLVRFCGKQFVLAPAVLPPAVAVALRSGRPSSVRGGVGADGGLLGFAAVGLVAFSPVLAVLSFGLLRQEGWPGRPGSAPSRVDHAWGLTGTPLAAAMFVLAVVDSLAAPAGWHSPAMDILTMGWGIRAGLTELVAFAVALGPLVAGGVLAAMLAR